MDALVKAKPSTAKGTYLTKISGSSTMGPGMTLDIPEIHLEMAYLGRAIVENTTEEERQLFFLSTLTDNIVQREVRL